MGCEEALRWGLVDGLTPRGELEALVETRIGEILAGAPRAMRLQKRLCRDWDEQPMSEAVEAGIRVFAQAFRSPEPEEYLRRFLDRRADSPGDGQVAAETPRRPAAVARSTARDP